MKYPRTWTSDSSTSVLISTAGITSTPSRFPAATARSTPAVVSWSATASTVTPASRASCTNASGFSRPSLAVVWVCRSIRAPVHFEDALDSPRLPRLLVHVHRHGVELRRPGGDLEAHRQRREEPFEDAFSIHADDAVPRAGHPDVGDVGGSLREDTLVRRLHVGMGADQCADLPVEIPAHRDLFARGLGVEVQDDDPRPLAYPLDLRPHHAKRVIDLGHEHASLEVEHGDGHPILRGRDGRPAARHAGRVVERSDNARLRVEEFVGVPMLPDVVAAGDDIHAGAEDLVRHLTAQPRASGRVLTIGDDEAGIVTRAQPGQALLEDAPPRPPVDVPDHQEEHARVLPSVLDDPGLAEHGHLDLPRVLHLILDLLRDITGERRRRRVIDVRGPDDDAHLAPRLDGVRLLDAAERRGDALEPLQPLDVHLGALLAGARTAGRDGIAGGDEDGFDEPGLFVPMMVGDRVEDFRRFVVSPADVHADGAVRALDLVRQGLPDVVQQPRASRDLRIRIEELCHEPREQRHFHRVLQQVLPVRVTEAQPAEELDLLRVQAVHAGFERGPLHLLADALLDLALGLLYHLLDAGGMDAPVGDELLQRDLGDLATDGIE